MTATYEALVLEKSPLVTFGYVVQVALSLIIVLALFYLISRYILPKFNINPQGREIQVLDRVGIEPQLTAYLIKLRNHTYFIMAGGKGVALIDKFKEGEL